MNWISRHKYSSTTRMWWVIMMAEQSGAPGRPSVCGGDPVRSFAPWILSRCQPASPARCWAPGRPAQGLHWTGRGKQDWRVLCKHWFVIASGWRSQTAAGSCRSRSRRSNREAVRCEPLYSAGCELSRIPGSALQGSLASRRERTCGDAHIKTGRSFYRRFMVGSNRRCFTVLLSLPSSNRSHSFSELLKTTSVLAKCSRVQTDPTHSLRVCWCDVLKYWQI